MIIIDIDKKKFDFPFAIKPLLMKITKEVLIIEKYKDSVSINVEIVGNRKIKNINKTMRNIDKVTDVLSFPSGDYDYDTKTVFLGDVVICYDRMISQAKKYCHSIKREFSFLYIHSLLHLLGYDHMKKNEEAIMFKKQDMILDKLKIYR